ncbi:MAG TPA: hypothetical protein VNU46_06965 [Gemmatimonadaceae bacterium]|jgi:hypothetical protein|nr:hypothetical protein [Gemmatimonadaceae bacterium]
MFLLAISVWMQVQAAQPAPTAQSGQVTVQAVMQPETVTVGQHFTVTVTVHAPAASAADIQFPEGPDTAGNQGVVTAFAPAKRHDVAQGGFVDATTTYSLAAWVPGKTDVGLDDVTVAKTHLKLTHDTVLVSSVLPKDSVARTKAKPKPPRGVLPLPPLYKRLLRDHPKSFISAIIIGLLILASLIAWILWWRSRRPVEVGPTPEWVDNEFDRVEAMHLVDRGENELHSILMTKVVRDYLIRKFPSVHASATTRELVAALRSESLIPAEETLALFERIDLLKFAQGHIQKDDALAVGTESRAVVHEVMDRIEAARVAAELEAQRVAAVAEAASGSGTSGKKPTGKPPTGKPTGKNPNGRKAA